MSANRQVFDAFEPYFGRRELECGPLERIDFAAWDGTALCLHHVRKGGTRGPVLLAPGTAMSGLSFCIDTVGRNIVEFLTAEGFDVWLLDWRTSPLLRAHKRPYTIDDVARFDWPAAIQKVRELTKVEGQEQKVSVLAHCVASPCLFLSVLRGYVRPQWIRAVVASAVGLHLTLSYVHYVKIHLYLDKILPKFNMIRQNPSETGGQLADYLTTIVSWWIPASYYYSPRRRHSWRVGKSDVGCSNRACYHHSATFGEVIYHPRLNQATHNITGDLIPECLVYFLKDIARCIRCGGVLEAQDMRSLDRLRLPIFFMSGVHNRMFTPLASEQTFDLLTKANGRDLYTRKVYKDFGHVDCYLSEDAEQAIWPDIARAFDPVV